MGRVPDSAHDLRHVFLWSFVNKMFGMLHAQLIPLSYVISDSYPRPYDTVYIGTADQRTLTYLLSLFLFGS